MMIELKGRPVVPGKARGPALVSKMPISFLGGVDPHSGIVIEKGHDLEGKCVKGVILCFPHGHGSTVGSYILYALAKKGLGPKAIVNRRADPVVVVGAIISEIPMIDQVALESLRTGDTLEVDGSEGTLKIFRR